MNGLVVSTFNKSNKDVCPKKNWIPSSTSYSMLFCLAWMNEVSRLYFPDYLRLLLWLLFFFRYLFFLSFFSWTLHRLVFYVFYGTCAFLLLLLFMLLFLSTFIYFFFLSFLYGWKLTIFLLWLLILLLRFALFLLFSIIVLYVISFFYLVFVCLSFAHVFSAFFLSIVTNIILRSHFFPPFNWSEILIQLLKTWGYFFNFIRLQIDWSLLLY